MEENLGMKQRLVLYFFHWLFFNVDNTESKCPTKWLSSGTGYCYLYQDSLVDYFWQNASDYCQGQGATLPILSNQNDQEIYNSLMTTLNVDPAETQYLGLSLVTDKLLSSTWLWMDGSNISSYNNWDPSSPSGDGTCVYMLGLNVGNTWNDYACNAVALPFACQLIDYTTTSSTTTTTTTPQVITYAAFTCPTGWYLSDTQQCYLYINNLTNTFLWNDALNYCRNLGASLPIFSSIDEQLAYNNLMISLNVPSQEVHYLGYYSSGPDSQWMWADNVTRNFTFWDSISPSGDGYCTYMEGWMVNNTWNDYSCTYDSSYIPFCCQLYATMTIPPIFADMNISTDFLADPMSLTSTLQDVGPFLISSLNDSMKEILGQPFTDLVRVCTYETTDCSDKSNFQYLYNPTFGNCYSFNYGNLTKYHVSDVGPDYGLRILLQANQADYSCSSQNAGFRISFHENSLPVYPDSEGYNIPPGTSSAISLSQSRTIRLGYPYENCAKTDGTNYGTNYTVEDCLRICYQNYLIQQCQCSDPRYPSKLNSTVCQPNKKNCLDYVSYCLFDTAVENCDCPPPCSEITYYPTITSVTIYSTDIYKTTFCRTSSNVSFCEGTFNENFAILYVYYRSMTTIEYGQVKSYGIMNLLSDFSGVTGLLLGVCVITLPEVVFFFFSVSTLCCKAEKQSRAKPLKSRFDI